MLEEELRQLVKEITSEKCEKQHLELKKALGGAPTKLYSTLSSFSNQNGGGIIVFEPGAIALSVPPTASGVSAD